MAWLALQFHAPAALVDDCAALLDDLGALAVSASDGGARAVLEPAPGATPLWDDTRLEAMFHLDVDVRKVRDTLTDFAVARNTSCVSFDVRFVGDEDWTAVSRERAAPRRFGRRLWVAPNDVDEAALERALSVSKPATPAVGTRTHSAADGGEPCLTTRVVVKLDPGLAFGTGEHPTTALCLEWLDENLQPGARVVDYGCGSGILGLAALRLGAAHVLAVDYDAQARVATAMNATKNGFAGERIGVFPPEALPGTARHRQHLVLANILADPLIRLAPALCELLAPAGRLVLSGLLEAQLATVCRAYPQIEFGTPRITSGWALIAGTNHRG